MNIRNSNISMQYKLMSQLFSKMTGKTINIDNPLDKMNARFQDKSNTNNEEILNSQGISGMCMTGKDPAEYRKPIEISEEGQQKLFDMVKSEFIQNNGVLEGDTTRKTEVYSDYLRSIPKEDRLRASWTMDSLERKYRAELVGTVKEAKPNWNIGNRFDSSILKDITRESIAGDKQAKALDIRA